VRRTTSRAPDHLRGGPAHTRRRCDRPESCRAAPLPAEEPGTDPGPAAGGGVGHEQQGDRGQVGVGVEVDLLDDLLGVLGVEDLLEPEGDGGQQGATGGSPPDRAGPGPDRPDGGRLLAVDAPLGQLVVQLVVVAVEPVVAVVVQVVVVQNSPGYGAPGRLPSPPMLIAIPLFDALTALDAVGPYEALQRLPDVEVRFVGHRRGEVRSENGFLGLTVDATFDEVPDPDVVVVPGGVGTRSLLDDEAILGWIAKAHAGTRFTTSVCTGSLLLAAAGLLDGLTATTHWAVYEELAKTGAIPVAERVVEHLDQRIITAAGVSSGIDMALVLVERMFGPERAQLIQLAIEYDPQPPFNAGALEKASEAVVARAAELAAARRG
jgi:putative intracellular protease/amidase